MKQNLSLIPNCTQIPNGLFLAMSRERWASPDGQGPGLVGYAILMLAAYRLYGYGKDPKFCVADIIKETGESLGAGAIKYNIIRLVELGLIVDLGNGLYMFNSEAVEQ